MRKAPLIGFVGLILFFTLGSNKVPNSIPALDDKNFSVICRVSNYSLEDFNSGATTAFSPDHEGRALLTKEGSFRIQRGQRDIGEIRLPNLSSNIRLSWSPDSEKLAITYSDGGAEGAFHASIFDLRGGQVHSIERPVAVAFDDFKAHYYCQPRGNNVYAEGWTEDSKKLLILTEVFPTGDCGKIFGRMGAYIVDLDGTILRRYDDQEARRFITSCERSGRATVP